MTTTEKPPTIPKLAARSWKALAKLDDQEDHEQLRQLLVDVLEALDAMGDGDDE